MLLQSRMMKGEDHSPLFSLAFPVSLSLSLSRALVAQGAWRVQTTGWADMSVDDGDDAD